MKATGIVRRIDALGRIVIPKEIRRSFHIQKGTALEIFVDHNGEVILKKYSLIGELGDFAQEYADSLHESTNHIVLISDQDTVVSVAGSPGKQWIGTPVITRIEKAMESRKCILLSKIDLGDENLLWQFEALVIAPIISEGDLIGAVMLCTNESDNKMGELELKLSETAAGFLAKQMEQTK